MSQYRDDRDAAHRRIEALEARVADRDAEIRSREAALVARDEEILRLQRELELAGGLGPRHMRSVSAAWASRIVGAATGLAIVAAGAGVILVRSSASASPQPAPVACEQPAAPIHADPLVTSAVDWASQTAHEGASAGDPRPDPRAPAEPTEAPTGTVAPEEAQMRQKLEPRVWGGRASQDEVRMLKAICAHQGDGACRKRAQAELARSRAQQP